MPECVEVKIITEQLSNVVSNQILKKIQIIGGRFLHSPPENFNFFSQNLPTKITQVNCKGKFIWIELENGWYIFNTLGMTGSWGDKKEKHSSIKIVTNFSEVYFTDIRRFGTMKFLYGKENLNKKLNSLGPDLLNYTLKNQSTKYIFRDLLKNKKYLNHNLSEMLMNQKIFSGIGNYLKSEILYKSKISPWRNCSSLTEEECFSLAESSSNIIKSSYDMGGTILATYKNFKGEMGKFGNKLQVYKKSHDPLGNLVKIEETPDKRTTYWVPDIQK